MWKRTGSPPVYERMEGEERKKVQCNHQDENLIRFISSSMKILKISKSCGSTSLLLHLSHSWTFPNTGIANIKAHWHVFPYALNLQNSESTQITNNYSQLPMNNQSSIAFRVKHAAPISNKRSFTETRLYISNWEPEWYEQHPVSWTWTSRFYCCRIAQHRC